MKHALDPDDLAHMFHHMKLDPHEEILYKWNAFKYRQYFEDFLYSPEDLEWLIDQGHVTSYDLHECLDVLTYLPFEDISTWELLLRNCQDPDRYVLSCLESNKAEYLDLLYKYGAVVEREHFQRALSLGFIDVIKYYIRRGFAPTEREMLTIPAGRTRHLIHWIEKHCFVSC